MAELKILVIGDSEVGKTCLTLRYATGTFPDTPAATIGVEFKTVHGTTSSGHDIRAQVWDTAGEERFRALAGTVYRGAHGVIIMYDVTRPETADHAARWVAEVRRYAPDNCALFLVGNKSDLSHIRAVPRQAGEALAREVGAAFAETSALANNNVAGVFQKAIDAAYERAEPMGQATGGTKGRPRNAAEPKEEAKGGFFSRLRCTML